MKVLLLSAMLFCGCSLSPELIRALAEDDASVCAASDIRGGAGGVTVGAGGYGQSTFTFCRSKMPNSKISIKPDGTISIEHGASDEKVNP